MTTDSAIEQRVRDAIEAEKKAKAALSAATQHRLLVLQTFNELQALRAGIKIRRTVIRAKRTRDAPPVEWVAVQGSGVRRFYVVLREIVNDQIIAAPPIQISLDNLIEITSREVRLDAA